MFILMKDFLYIFNLKTLSHEINFLESLAVPFAHLIFRLKEDWLGIYLYLFLYKMLFNTEYDL